MAYLVSPPHVDLSFFSDKISEDEMIGMTELALKKFKKGVLVTYSDEIIIQNLFSEGSTHLLKILGHTSGDIIPAHNRIVSLISSEQDVTKTKTQRTNLLNLFTYLCDSLDPCYATITTEYSLETPYELCKDDRSYAFRDFYLSNSYLKTDLFNNIITLANSENIPNENTEKGKLFLSGLQFRPEGYKSDQMSSSKLSLLVIESIKRMECYKFTGKFSI